MTPQGDSLGPLYLGLNLSNRPSWCGFQRCIERHDFHSPGLRAPFIPRVILDDPGDIHDPALYKACQGVHQRRRQHVLVPYAQACHLRVPAQQLYVHQLAAAALPVSPTPGRSHGDFLSLFSISQALISSADQRGLPPTFMAGCGNGVRPASFPTSAVLRIVAFTRAWCSCRRDKEFSNVLAADTVTQSQVFRKPAIRLLVRSRSRDN